MALVGVEVPLLLSWEREDEEEEELFLFLSAEVTAEKEGREKEGFLILTPVELGLGVG